MRLGVLKRYFHWPGPDLHLRLCLALELFGLAFSLTLDFLCLALSLACEFLGLAFGFGGVDSYGVCCCVFGFNYKKGLRLEVFRFIREFAGNLLPLSMPATSVSDTARSTVFRPSFTDSVADLCWTRVVENRRVDGRAASRTTGTVL